MALGTILAGKNGLVKVGASESDNIEQWTYTRTSPVTNISILNAANNATVIGTAEVSGTIDLYFDPSDATHVSMSTDGTGTLELYMDGEASNDYYFTGDAVFSDFTVTDSAADGSVKASVSWSATSAWTMEQVA